MRAGEDDLLATRSQTLRKFAQRVDGGGIEVGTFLQADHKDETAARVALVTATALVIRSGLAVMGVTPVEEMR